MYHTLASLETQPNRATPCACCGGSAESRVYPGRACPACFGEGLLYERPSAAERIRAQERRAAGMLARIAECLR